MINNYYKLLIYTMTDFAFTLTISPYKRFKGKQYRSLSPAEQREVIVNYFDNDDDTIKSFIFETCPSSKMIHAHGVIIINTMKELHQWQQDIWYTFGYQGKNNKLEDTILCKPITDDRGWKRYMMKDQPIEEPVISKYEFEQLAEIDNYKTAEVMDHFDRHGLL